MNKSYSDKKYPEPDMIKIPEFLTDNIFDMLAIGGRLFFNRQLPFLYITVLLFLPTFSFIHNCLIKLIRD